MKKTVLWVALAASISCSKQPVDGSDVGSDTGGVVTDSGATDVPVADVDGRPDVAEVGDAGLILGSDSLTTPQPGVSPDGVVDVTPVPGAARAARFLAADTGFHGLWSHCKQGDIKLFNGKLEACITGVGTQRHEALNGGALVDIRPTGKTAPDVLDFFIPRVGYNTLDPERVEVVRDGTDGGPAVIRVTGTDTPMPYFVGVVGDNLFQPLGMDVVVEYRLGPGADFIEVVTFITNNTDVRVAIIRGDFIAFGDRTATFREKLGLQGGSVGAGYQAIHAFGNDYSYAWVVPAGEVRPAFGAIGGDIPWEITQLDQFALPAGDTATYRGRFVIGDGTLDSVRVRANEELGRAAGVARTIEVTDGTAAPVAGRMVEVFRGEDAVTADETDEDGRIVATLEPGTYRVTVAGVLGGGGLEQELVVGDDTAYELAVPTTAKLRIAATADGVATPAFVQLQSDLGSTKLGALSGQVIELMPGTWEVAVGKGPEYDASVETVDVTAGAEVVADPALTRVVDTADWVVGDFHQHMEPSSDSTVRVEDRIVDNVAMGLELLTPTDHDVVTDLAPYIAELGLDDVISTFPGLELSPVLAHLNVYPVPWSRDLAGRGTVPISKSDGMRPRRRSVPELIALARAMPTDPVVQINHGRDSSGLFELTGFDPEVGPDAVTHEWWSSDFDAMELVNSFGKTCQQFADWSGFWNAGMTPAGIGSSDSHGIWGDVGSARTYLHAPGIAPNAITPELVRDAIRANRATVASHAFLTFGVEMLPGDLVTTTPNAPVEFPVRVQTPPWAEIDTLQVVVNGAVVDTIPVTPVSETLDFDAVVARTFAADAWVVFVASGPAPAGEYQPNGRITYAFNNPIRVDVNADGFQAPGPGPLDLGTLVFCR